MNLVCYMWLMYKMVDIRVQFDVTGDRLTMGLKKSSIERITDF